MLGKVYGRFAPLLGMVLIPILVEALLGDVDMGSKAVRLFVAGACVLFGVVSIGLVGVQPAAASEKGKLVIGRFDRVTLERAAVRGSARA